MLNRIVIVQVSDTTGDAMKNNWRLKKYKYLFPVGDKYLRFFGYQPGDLNATLLCHSLVLNSYGNCSGTAYTLLV
jgi:hypothetical protein